MPRHLISVAVFGDARPPALVVEFVTKESYSFSNRRPLTLFGYEFDD
jgi:hypothetical protein